MTLHAYTARISTRDPDRLDVTRKSGGPEGHPFAPSWKILGPVLSARREAGRAREVADRLPPVAGADIARVQRRAGDLERRAWCDYIPRFLDEMRESQRRHPDVWRRLLVRDRVVLACYCTDPERCHRTLLALDVLPALGALYCGELPQ